MILAAKRSLIWQSKKSRRQGLKALSVDARLLLGILGTCGNLSSAEMADAMNRTTTHVKLLLNELYSSRDRTIRDALDNGISLDVAVVVPNYRVRLRCRVCSQILTRVPCCKCLASDEESELDPNRRAPSVWESTVLRKPRKPTKHLPGTKAKMDVMQRRVSRRCQPFHPGDAQPNWDF